MEVTFVTTNKNKFRAASTLLKRYQINLIQEELETPEIQDDDFTKVAEFSALWATEKLKKTVLVNDFGYCIKSLNDFPGPYAKYALNRLGIEDWTKLLNGQKNRSVEIVRAFALASPSGKVASIRLSYPGELLSKPSNSLGQNPLQRFFVPKGFDKPYAEFSDSERDVYWQRTYRPKKLSRLIKEVLQS